MNGPARAFYSYAVLSVLISCRQSSTAPLLPFHMYVSVCHWIDVSLPTEKWYPIRHLHVYCHFNTQSNIRFLNLRCQYYHSLLVVVSSTLAEYRWSLLLGADAQLCMGRGDLRCRSWKRSPWGAEVDANRRSSLSVERVHLWSRGRRRLPWLYARGNMISITWSVIVASMLLVLKYNY